MKNPLSMFRMIGFSEGISFLLLLGIAMPLKYMFDYPLAVTVVGAIHGGLFVLYIMAIVYMKFAFRWSIIKSILAVISSVIPFGPFIFDAKLVRD
jgi:integral membrane protein